MNEDHGDAVMSYAMAFTSHKALDKSVLSSVDAIGIDINCIAGDQSHNERILFPQELTKAEEIRGALIKLVKLARTIEKYQHVLTPPEKLIGCAKHDYIEAACTFNYTLDIEMREGEIIRAKALDTKIVKNEVGDSKAEHLLLGLCGREVLLRSDLILAITPLDSDARFSRVMILEP